MREQNEDSFILLNDEDLFVVADGMGGHNSGEVASQITISAMKSFYEDEALEEKLREEQHDIRNNSMIPSTFAEFRLMRAVESANRSIYNTAQRFEAYREMGTTVVSVCFVKSRMYVAFVGDSRVYRVRDGEIEQLSVDHSLANEYVRLNVIRKEDVRTFPYRNVIVKALGLASHVEVETFYKACKPGDVFLLCSDGLTDLVEDAEIRDVIVSSDGNLAVANQGLVDRANHYGGIDNITSVLVQVSDQERTSRRKS